MNKQHCEPDNNGNTVLSFKKGVAMSNNKRFETLSDVQGTYSDEAIVRIVNAYLDNKESSRLYHQRRYQEDRAIRARFESEHPEVVAELKKALKAKQ